MNKMDIDGRSIKEAGGFGGLVTMAEPIQAPEVFTFKTKGEIPLSGSIRKISCPYVVKLESDPWNNQVYLYETYAEAMNFIADIVTTKDKGTN